jgi:ribosomal protein L39E
MKTTNKMKNTKDIGIDLFEDYENIPKKVQIILDKYAEKFGDDFGNMDYKDMADMHNEIYAVGYTFESGLDNQPYDLRPIGTKGKSEMDEFRKGGSLDKENSDMVLNNNKQISHHTKELANAVNKNKNIPAWVVAKINRSATDISDATHYLEGAKYKKGGGVGTIKERVIDYYINNSDNEDLINLMGVNDVPNLIPVAEKWVNNRNSYYDKIFSAIDGIHNRTWAENKFEELGLEKFSNGGNLEFCYSIGGL